MKISAVHFLWAVLLGAMVMGIAGCASDEPDNDSVRPWGASENGGGSVLPVQNEQHSE